MKRVGMFLTSMLVISAFQVGGGGLLAAHADTKTINFENPPYIPGSINGQDGWKVTGPYDQEVVANSVLGVAPASFAAQSFRMSNAITSDAFGDQVFSKPLTDEAGEADAVNGGFSGGTRQPHFEATFDIASTVPGSEQSGLQLAVSPDRGDGARMSFVRFRDTPAGLAIDFSDYQDKAPLGAVSNLTDGCGAEDAFVTTVIASGLNRSKHTVKLTMDLLNGPHNDVVKVFVDGALVHTGTSWEDYFRFCAESGGDNTSRTVDSLLFRAGGTAAPATSGKGFLFDNLTLTSGPLAVGTADLSVTKKASSPAKIGSPLTYTITVHNAGPGAATGVTMTDTLPSSVAFVSANSGTGTCSQAAGTVTCNIGNLALNGSVTITIVVTPSVDGKITNTAKVAGTTSDPTMANNSASVTTTVGATSQKHARSISLRLRNGLRARGKVRVSDGFAACASNVPVRVQKRVSGTWKTIKSVKTSSNGKYSARLPDKPGKYRSLAPKVKKGTDICGKAKSPTRMH